MYVFTGQAHIEYLYIDNYSYNFQFNANFQGLSEKCAVAEGPTTSTAGVIQGSSSQEGKRRAALKRKSPVEDEDACYCRRVRQMVSCLVDFFCIIIFISYPLYAFQ